MDAVFTFIGIAIDTFISVCVMLLVILVVSLIAEDYRDRRKAQKATVASVEKFLQGERDGGVQRQQ